MGFVLTRLHYRYQADGLGEDLVFQAAPPIVGGRGTPNREGQLDEKGAKSGSMNAFQGRYVILHSWEGELACNEPVRGTWGGPPGEPTGRPRQPMAAASRLTAGTPTTPTISLAAVLAQELPSLGIASPPPTAPEPEGTPAPKEESDGCQVVPAGGLGALTVALLAVARRRP